MEPHSMSVDDLIAASADLEGGLFDQLAAVTARASSESGVEVTVTLDGMIIALDLAAEALRLGPDALAAEISRLTHQASAAALTLGIDILEPVAGPELLSLLDFDLPEPPAPRATTDDDFSQIETWALPH